MIQNDIGTTDAHVLVLHVEGLAAILTYTDVHAQRAAFFQSLFKPFSVVWEADRPATARPSARRRTITSASAAMRTPDAKALANYLSFLGSRIVFLIDWNRARKRLREFLRKGDVRASCAGRPATTSAIAASSSWASICSMRRSSSPSRRRCTTASGCMRCWVPRRRSPTEVRSAGGDRGAPARPFRALHPRRGEGRAGAPFPQRQESLLSIASSHAQIIFDPAAAWRDGLLLLRGRRRTTALRPAARACPGLGTGSRSTGQPDVLADAPHPQAPRSDMLEPCSTRRTTPLTGWRMRRSSTFHAQAAAAGRRTADPQPGRAPGQRRELTGEATGGGEPRQPRGRPRGFADGWSRPIVSSPSSMWTANAKPSGTDRALLSTRRFPRPPHSGRSRPLPWRNWLRPWPVRPQTTTDHFAQRRDHAALRDASVSDFPREQLRRHLPSRATKRPGKRGGRRLQGSGLQRMPAWASRAARLRPAHDALPQLRDPREASPGLTRRDC